MGMEAIRAITRSLDPDPAHAFQVSRLALGLFDQLSLLHGLSPPAKRLLEAGALLHDVGLSVDGSRHHKHALEIIRTTELPGFSALERDMVACIARYHRKADPAPSHPVFRKLDADAQVMVTRLAALLRVADGLDRAHRASVIRLDVDCTSECLEITVHQDHPSPTDLLGAARKQALFESVFQTKVKFVALIENGVKV